MAKRKEERLPKGFGGVVFMKGNRAKPYVVRIKVGTTINEEKGTAYPKYKVIGYAKTRADGILMLQDYHNNPYDYENHYTFADIYKKRTKINFVHWVINHNFYDYLPFFVL